MQTVKEYLEEWTTLRVAARKPRTIEREKELIRLHIAPFLGEIPLKKLRGKDVAELIAAIAQTGHTRTAEQIYTYLREALPRRIMEKVLKPTHETAEKRVLTPEEQRKLLPVVLEDPHALELLLAWCLGLRRGEILGLRWADVDLAAGMIRVRNQRQRIGGKLTDGTPKSRAGKRDLPIPGLLMPFLRARARIGGYVAECAETGLRGALVRCCGCAGVPYVTLHGLRHTMATNATRAGVGLRVLQQELGHAAVTTTARVYSHTDRTMLKDALESAWRVASP